MSPRIYRTKSKIHQALIQLLQCREIHRITIRELCAQAGVNRTTFYNHYGSQFDVLREMSQWFLEDINAALETADMSHPEQILKRVALVLSYMQERCDLSILLMDSEPEADFAVKLLSLPRIDAMLAEVLTWANDPFVRENTIAFAVHGACRVIRNWLKDPQGKDAYAAATLLLELAHRICRGGPISI